MKKKLYIIMSLFVLFSFGIAHKVLAKYVMTDFLNIDFYVDRTPPQIEVIENGKSEVFDRTQSNFVRKTNNIVIHTSDNVAIKENQYYYCSDDSNFKETTPQVFENGHEFIQEGYYKIVAIDTAGNATQIVVLLDKTPPNVFVNYFKKGEATLNSIRKTAGMQKHLTSLNKLNISQVEEVKEEALDEPLEANVNQEEIQNCLSEDFSEEDIEIEDAPQNEIMLRSLGDMYVGNEDEFRTALAMKASVIHIRQSIDFSSPIYINYHVTFVNDGESNSLRYRNEGDFIVVQNGGLLAISGIVIDGNSSGVGGMTLIHIQTGGYVQFVNSSILDGGIGNTGILINANSSLELWSCEILRCNLGINLQANGNLYFATQEGRLNNFYWNNRAIFIDNFSGNCDLSQNISIHDNTEYGVYVGNCSGIVNIFAGSYYQNTYAIRTCNVGAGGHVSIFGGSYYANNWGIWAGGNVYLRGGSIYSNYYGVVANMDFYGCFQMTGGSIYSNTAYAIYQNKTNDGGCTITGGSISGSIYLAQDNSYVNTNSSYPMLSIVPNSYYFKRKLVRTTNNSIAQSEISNVTVTPKDGWYKYVDNEYIVLWSEGNVIVCCKDYYGNIIKQETVHGNIGTSYLVVPPVISGYDLKKTPANLSGVYAQGDIVVELQYDLVNLAKVSFEDLLSGIVWAKYWYHPNNQDFSEEGTNLENGTILEDYGYYKIVVSNGVGLEREINFILNENSLTR